MADVFSKSERSQILAVPAGQQQCNSGGKLASPSLPSPSEWA